MPANDMLITPRGGHIDTVDDVLIAEVGLSVEERESATGERITLVHLDVARGGDVETPFSVGIPLKDSDIALLLRAFAGVPSPLPYMAQPPRGERLN